MKFLFSLIYICTAILLSKYAYAQESGIIFQNVFEEDFFLGNSIEVIFQDKKGYIWLSGGNDVFRYDGNKFINLHPFHNNTGNKSLGFIHTICEDEQGNIWFSNNSGLAQYIPKTERLVAFPLSNNSNFSTCYIQNDSTFWLGSKNGVFLFNPNIVNLKHDSLNYYARDLNIRTSGPVNFINIFKKWIIVATENKLLFIDEDQKKLEKEIDFDSLLNKNVSCNAYLMNKHGQIVIGTKKSGIYKLQINGPHSISNKTILEAFADSAYKFCGNDAGDLLIKTMTKLYVLRANHLGNQPLETFHCYTAHINNSAINHFSSVLCDRSGSLWTGAYENISLSNLPRPGVMFHQKTEDKDLCKQVKSIYYKGIKLCIAENRGLFIYDTLNNKYNNISLGDFHPLSGAGRMKMLDISTGIDSSLWLGTNHGLWKLAQNETEEAEFSFHWEKYKFHSGNADIILGNIIHSVLFQKLKNKKYLFLASNKGVFKLNLKTGQITNYQPNKKNTPAHIGVYEDIVGRIWTITRNSLYEIKGDELIDFTPFIKSYNEEFTFQKHAFESKPDSSIIFHTNSGALTFTPDKIRPRTNIPEILINSFYISGKEVGVHDTISGRIVLRKNIAFVDEIILAAQHNSFRFEFSLPDYYGNSIKKYKYKLAGIDDSWSLTGSSSPFANYANIPPGDYFLQVLGRNSDGLWGKKPKELHIIVLPPWHQTTWFRVIIVLFLVSTLFSMVYIRYQELRNRQVILESLVLKRTSEIEERNKLLEKQAENLNLMNNILEKKQEKILEQASELRRSNSTKDKFFSIIAHDLRNPFNLIIGFSELLRMKFAKNLPERANKYVNTIFQTAQKGSSLLENLLEWSRSQTGNLEFFPQIFSLEKLAEDCLSHFNSMALQKNISIENKINPLHYTYADENMTRTIFRNLLSNALKFTPEKGEIKLKSISEEKNLVVCIEDNGVGIKSRDLNKLFQMDKPFTTEGTNNEEGTGLGLMLVKEFVVRHNGKIWVESEYQVGSKFYFTLPLSNAYPGKN